MQVEHFQILFADISERTVQTYLTNQTTTRSSCDVTNSSACYFRVRAELDDSSLSSFYSSCLQISDQLIERKGN